MRNLIGDACDLGNGLGDHGCHTGESHNGDNHHQQAHDQGKLHRNGGGLSNGGIGRGNIQHIFLCNAAQRHSTLFGDRCAGGGMLIHLVGVDVIARVRCSSVVANEGQHMRHHVI